MREINLIVVHCSATPPTADVDAADIDRWHKQRGWDGIGYHYVVRRDGTLELGRSVEKAGVHTRGHNAKSIGVCMIGGTNSKGQAEDNFTGPQYGTLAWLLRNLRKEFPKAKITGHRDLSPDKDKDGKVEKHEWVKDCPSFDVQLFVERNKI